MAHGACCVCQDGVDASNTNDTRSTPSQHMGYACVPEMIAGLTGHNHLNIEFWRFMRVSHDEGVATTYGRLPWISVTFWIMIVTKLLLTILIVIQMRLHKTWARGPF